MKPFYGSQKTDHYTFNLDPVRIPAKYPGKKKLSWEKTKEKLSGNPKGKKSRRCLEYCPKRLGKEKYGILSMLKSNHVEKNNSPCSISN